MSVFSRWLPLALLLTAVLAHARAFGQLPLAPPLNQSAVVEPGSDAPKNLAEKRVEVAERLAQAEKEVESAETTAPETASVPNGGQAQDLEIKNQILRVIAQQKSATDKQVELEATKKDFADKLAGSQSDKSADGQKPLTFLQLDQLRDDLAAEEGRRDSFALSIATANQAVELAKSNAAEKDHKRQFAKEAAETTINAADKERLAKEFALAEKEHELAKEVVRLREIEMVNEKMQEDVYHLRVKLLTSQIARAAANAEFTREDLVGRLAEIAKEEDDLKYQLKNTDRDLARLDDEWRDKNKGLDIAAQNEQSLLSEQVETIRLRRQMLQHKVTALNQRLERMGKMRTAWNRRYAVVTGAAPSPDVISWEAETRQYLEQLGQETRLQSIRVDELRKNLSTVERKVQASSELPAEVAREILRQRDQLQTLSTIYDSNIVSLDNTRRLYDKLLAEIRHDEESVSWGDRLSKLWTYVVGVWSFPLTSVDDRPITVGKVVTGIVLLFLGFLASRYLARLLGRRVLPRLGMHEHAASALQSLAFYVFVLMFTLFSLRLVNVPLTMFTFLGGALAIGVGFGSQNIVNNFISGLIILAERPIRQGDLIEMEGLFGTVSRIGARSTRITTGNNLEIIVPNSTLLQNNVVNWTLSDDRIRTSVNIGVAYGSPTRDVDRLLKEAANEHVLVLNRPEPFVWFTDFGDNSLNFELHFWIQMRTLAERRRIESDIRHTIDALFKKAGIVIAFPQRDIHLDAVKPLDIRILTEQSAASQRAA